MQTTLADLPQIFSLMKLGLDLEKETSRWENNSLCVGIYYSLYSKEVSINTVVKEMQEIIEQNRKSVVSSIGEDLTKRIECFKFS